MIQKITPIILNLILMKDDTKLLDITSEIKYYNTMIPIQFLMNNINFMIENDIDISIKYMHKGKIINKKLSLIEYKNEKIYCLFE
jgi:hypothetical protein